MTEAIPKTQVKDIERNPFSQNRYMCSELAGKHTLEGRHPLNLG